MKKIFLIVTRLTDNLTDNIQCNVSKMWLKCNCDHTVFLIVAIFSYYVEDDSHPSHCDIDMSHFEASCKWLKNGGTVTSQWSHEVTVTWES